MTLVYKVRSNNHLRKLPLADKDNEHWELLEAAAADFYFSYNGAEYNWPIKFTIIDSENDEIICEGEVEMDYEPVFRA